MLDDAIPAMGLMSRLFTYMFAMMELVSPTLGNPMIAIGSLKLISSNWMVSISMWDITPN